MYTIQGYYRRWIKKQYNKHFNQDSIDDMLFKVASCPDCYLNGSCLNCGCPMNEMLTTNKACPDGKF